MLNFMPYTDYIETSPPLVVRSSGFYRLLMWICGYVFTYMWMIWDTGIPS